MNIRELKVVDVSELKISEYEYEDFWQDIDWCWGTLVSKENFLKAVLGDGDLEDEDPDERWQTALEELIALPDEIFIALGLYIEK